MTKMEQINAEIAIDNISVYVSKITSNIRSIKEFEKKKSKKERKKLRQIRLTLKEIHGEFMELIPSYYNLLFPRKK